MARRALISTLLIGLLAAPLFVGGGASIRTTHSQLIHGTQPNPMQVSALEAGLPLTWCGTETGSDQTVNATNDGAPKFKFFYVRASDQPDRFTDVASQMQRAIATIHAYMLNVSGGQRTIAVDLGTSCGSLYADITSLTLPGSLASYQEPGGEVDQTKAMDAVKQIAAGISGPPRHYIFLLDQFEPTNYMRGLGSQAIDDSPGAGNHNNDPGLVAFVATPAGAIGQPVNAGLPKVMLHEMSHTLGAVQSSAPHGTSAGHCTDGSDVMCYDDGSPEGAAYSAAVCGPNAALGIAQPFDCNGDDYFNPAPATGSYLATHWNVFNSSYLVRCTNSDPYCTLPASNDPLPSNPAARTVVNGLYTYKRGRRGKRVGSVTTTGAKQPGLEFVNNSVVTSRIRLPRGTWKVTVCFRESGADAVCESKRRRTSRTGRLSVPRIYVTTGTSGALAWGSVTIKPISRSLRNRRIDVRTAKKVSKFSLDFQPQ